MCTLYIPGVYMIITHEVHTPEWQHTMPSTETYTYKLPYVCTCYTRLITTCTDLEAHDHTLGRSQPWVTGGGPLPPPPLLPPGMPAPGHSLSPQQTQGTEEEQNPH